MFKKIMAVLLVCLIVVFNVVPVMAAIDVSKYPPVDNVFNPWDVLTEVPEGLDAVMGCDGFDEVIACQYYYASMVVYNDGSCNIVFRGFPNVTGDAPIVGIDFTSGDIYRVKDHSLVSIVDSAVDRLECKTLIVELDSNGAVTSSEYKEYICHSSGLGYGYILEPWTNIWVFDSLSSMNTYISSGDTSGLVSGNLAAKVVDSPIVEDVDVYNYRGPGDYDGLILVVPRIKHRDVYLDVSSTCRVELSDGLGNEYIETGTCISSTNVNIRDWFYHVYSENNILIYIRFDYIAEGWGIRSYDGKTITIDSVKVNLEYVWPDGSAPVLSLNYPNDIFRMTQWQLDLATKYRSRINNSRKI